MRLVNKISAGLGMLAGLGLANQALAVTCDSNSCEGTIKSIVQYHSAEPLNTQVQLDQDVGPSGCTLNAGKYWVIKPADENIFKVVLAAYLAGKAISLRRLSTETTCTAAYVMTE